MAEEKPKNKGGRPTNASLVDKGGRPTVFTDEVIQKLEYAFTLGCTDGEACLHADISKASLYNYQTANPDFLERKNLLKETPVFKARKSVITGIENDQRLALMYLERKKKDEFSLKTEHEVKGVGIGDVFMGMDADMVEALKQVLKGKMEGKE